jgi:dipeptidyl aminopeptidase/acylaminoacyl peptidase
MIRRRYWLPLALLIIACAANSPAQRRAFGLEDLYRIKNVSDVHVSPDGKSIVYVLTTSDLARARRTTQIWMMDAAGGQERRLSPEGTNAFSPRFSPDGRQIAFIMAKDGNANIFLVSAQGGGGETKQVTNISTGVADQLWSPDGKWMAFSTDVYPECGGDDACNKRIAERLEKGALKGHIADDLLYRHWNAWKDGQRTHIYLVSVAGGEVRDLTPGEFDSPAFSLGGPLQYDFSPDGTEFVYVSNHDKNPESSTNNDLWVISLTDAKAGPKNITAGNRAYDGSPKYSPDGRYIAYRTQREPGYESDLFRLALYDRRAGTSAVLTEAFRNWVDEFEWMKDSKTIYFNASVEGVNPVYSLDVASKKITEIFRDRTIGDLNYAPDGRGLVYTVRSTGEPAEIYSTVIGGVVNPRRLSHFNDDFMKEVDVRPAEMMWVTAGDGQKIQVFIVKPHDFDPAKKYPLILNVHGGPQQMWGDSFRGDWQVYPGAGYVVAFSNPRGSTGYGQDFTAQISGDMGGRVYDDLMKVTDALERLPYVDRNRMGAMGWSYGGYMMMWFEGHTTRFKALASMMGIYDWAALYGATEELWWPEWDLKGTPWTNAEGYAKWSPSSYVRNFKTPALVISGERDYRVPYTQSLQFFTALRKMNVPARLLIYSNAGHWPSWYEMMLYYTAHLEWFHQYLGGAPPPWSSQAFVRNAVFDRTTGQRFDESDTKRTPPAQTPAGKPDTKPTTP